jgi:hypothetical protein
MFVTITEKEFFDTINSGKREPEILQRNDIDRQLVVGWSVREGGKDPGLMVTVYSSVFGRPGEGRSRGNGKDSMRVCVVDVTTKSGVGRTSYTQRTTGWEKRLKTKIREMFARASDELEARKRYGSPEAAPACPKCRGKMKLRTAGRGKNKGSRFWGCTNYPRCKGTKNVGERPTAPPPPQKEESFEQLAELRRMSARWSF